MRSLLAALLFTLSLAAPAMAGESVEIKTLEEGASSPPASVDELAWLVGHWKGSGLGGQSEEFIAPPLDGQMIGAFRQTKADGSLWFYEFYQIVEDQGSLVMRIKHFNPDLTGWEEKDDYVAFRLVETSENAVYFDGLTFKMTGPDEMRAAVVLEGDKTASFIYNRVSP
ncbi:DUF6265 family protein [Hyphococcus flavus]|uniref:DUF6265 family protein n=1 Tax=Hyphococcus flavus TaxID=1866326 RepID=A0AAE9ZE59_9PROT|nr:DUF6265 family protein [Hyphococcus flavus]WDI32045.1 DUF6265 family protein [Hyphococcus flavus]